ncbi:MAG TPA: FKBP-type peptidylprolyl isomerase [Sphingobacteriaceae bacterium]|nr:FKBP-type peptidylprolyl isomerase [Sphingobacteriaceae bacterium]
MKKLIILGIAALGLASCQKFKEGAGGMLYSIHTDKAGPNIKEGDFVALKAIQKTDGDSIIYNSYDFDRPNFMYAEAPRFKGDLTTGLLMLSEGDSATIKVNMDSISAMAKKTGAMPPAFKSRYMIYTLKIIKVIPKDTANLSGFQAKVEAFFQAETEAAKKAEDGKIKAFIASKGMKPTVTASGLNYVITKQGAGAKAVKGDTVQLNYAVSLLSGKLFDTSLPELSKKSAIYNAQRPYAPIKVAVGTGAVMAGFEEAITLFPVGTKATIILPSKLANGDQGGALPPYTPLTFDIDILNVIHPGSGAAAPPTAKK